MKKIDLSKEKIRYVAIGDSISEGYNGKYNFGYAGSMDLDKNISGTSWPSFLARNIQKIDKNILESYDNFSMSGTRPEDWNYFLGVNKEKYSYENSIDKINYSIWLNELKNNPERRRIKKQFKNFGKNNKNDFDNLINKLQEANLITINIGANYIIPKIPVDKIIDSLINYPDSLTQLKKIINDSVAEIESDIILMINRIKEITNNNASIYIVGYNKMFGTFWEIADLFFKKININLNVIEYCYDKLNNSIKNCAKKTKISYISTNNKKFWKEHSYMMCNVFYEAHPTIFGYKKIAQDVLAKISLSNNFFANTKNIHKKIISFNDKYIKEDKLCFNNSLDFSKLNISDDELIKKIFGTKDELLFKRTKIEDGSKFLETKLYFEQSLDPKNDPRNYLSTSIKKSFLIILNSLQIDFDKSSINNFSTLIEIDYINKFIIKINLISVIANKIQDKIDQYFVENNKNIPIDDFISIFFDQVLNFEFITWVLIEFSNFWTEEQNNKMIKNKKILFNVLEKLLTRNRIKTIIQTISNRLIKYIFAKRIKTSFSEDYFDKIINYISSNIDFVEFGKIIINFYFSNLNQIKNIKQSNELLDLFLQDEKINLFLHKVIKKSISSIKFNKKIIIELMVSLSIPNTSSNIKIMKDFFENIISLIIQENELFTDVIAKMIIDFVQNKERKLTLQYIIEFLLEFDKKSFWSKLSNIKIDKLNQTNFNNIVNGINLIFDNLQYDGIIYKNILSLTNPKGLVLNNDKIKMIKFLKFLDKLSKLKKIMSDFCNMLISNYYVSENKSKNKNIYYKSFYRILLTTILINRQLFQKNIKKNYFMDGKISIVKVLFQIAGYKHGKNKSIDDLMLDMFGEQGNYDLIMNDELNNNIQPLRLIYSLEKKQYKNNVLLDKQLIIFNSLKKGYID